MNFFEDWKAFLTVGMLDLCVVIFKGDMLGLVFFVFLYYLSLVKFEKNQKGEVK